MPKFYSLHANPRPLITGSLNACKPKLKEYSTALSTSSSSSLFLHGIYIASSRQTPPANAPPRMNSVTVKRMSTPRPRQPSTRSELLIQLNMFMLTPCMFNASAKKVFSAAHWTPDTHLWDQARQSRNELNHNGHRRVHVQ